MDSTSSPGCSVSPPYIVAMPIVVLSVSANCAGVPPVYAAAASMTAASCSMPASRAASVSKASRRRWWSIAASTWAVCGESTNAANCDTDGSRGNCARTDSQSSGSKSGTTRSALGDPVGVAPALEGVVAAEPGPSDGLSASVQPASSRRTPRQPTAEQRAS